MLTGSAALADESGVSFWLPGQYASYAAVPGTPGWSFEASFYHATADASGTVNFARGGALQAGLKSPSDYLMLTPTYNFATPVMGAQAALGLSFLYGRNHTTATATLTGPGGTSISGSRSDEVWGFGDISPYGSLKWTRDVHNVMVYATANVPAGAYQPTRLAALGIGHWAVDSGAGYTYLDEKKGFEASAVVGFTYNFKNPDTQYQSGVDAHLDWAVSPYVGDTFHIGAVGYVYQQLTADRGGNPLLGDFKSRVVGIGPQIGFFIPLAGRQGYLNLRAYYEFAAQNRLEGWNGFITFSIEPPEQKVPRVARR